MKHITKILPVCCVMFVALLFAGCSIKAPTVSVDGCLVSWDWVNNATSYEIDVNGTSYYTTENYYNIAPLIQENRTIKEIRVKAITTNKFLTNSGYSDVVSVAVGDQILAQPQNFQIKVTSASYICSWDSVKNADYYCIKLVNTSTNKIKYFATNGESYNLYGATEEAGEYMAYVFAYSNSQSHIYAPSNLSEGKKFVMDVALETPEEVTLKMVGSSIICSWPTVKDAYSYNLSIVNGATITGILNDSSKNTQSIDLTQKGITLDEGEVLFACVAAVGAENSGYLESPYTDVCSLYSVAAKSSFASVKYDFIGEEFDFVADSSEELRRIIWYSLFYRITDIKCFVNYQISNTSVLKEFEKHVKSYNEIKHITYSIAPSIDGSYVMHCEYINCEYPEKTAPKSSKQSQNIVPDTYTTTPRDATFQDFAINDRANSIMVYSSEQLYYAIQSGYKPTFPAGVSYAKIAYEEAKNVLRQIVSDNMTDYQKTLAIYEWLCFNTHYDHELLEIDAAISQGKMSGSSFDYRGFYIEGVLFDDGQAVCDGIAKTFALLCGLENIECYKVIGISNTELNQSNNVDHAWNKVKLDLVGDDGVGEWYVVDATQNDFSDNTNTEFLTHSFFLITDAEASKIYKHKEIYPNADVANTEFSFYKNKKYNGINDTYIQDIQELIALASYTKTNLTSVEFMIDKTNFLNYNFENICEAFKRGTVPAVIYTRSYEADGMPNRVIYLVVYNI